MLKKKTQNNVNQNYNDNNSDNYQEYQKWSHIKNHPLSVFENYNYALDQYLYEASHVQKSLLTNVSAINSYASSLHNLNKQLSETHLNISLFYFALYLNIITIIFCITMFFDLSVPTMLSSLFLFILIFITINIIPYIKAEKEEKLKINKKILQTKDCIYELYSQTTQLHIDKKIKDLLFKPNQSISILAHLKHYYSTQSPILNQFINTKIQSIYNSNDLIIYDNDFYQSISYPSHCEQITSKIEEFADKKINGTFNKELSSQLKIEKNITPPIYKKKNQQSQTFNETNEEWENF